MRWNRMMQFWQEQRGVSAVIGMLMMLLLFTTMAGIVQVSQVPIWNSQVEAEHAATVYDDLIALKAGLSDVAVWRLPKSAVIRMGRLYPNRMIFVNPGIGITSSLRAEPVTITVGYTIDVPGSPIFTQTFQSSRLIYEAQGSSVSTLVYEYGVIIRDLVTVNLSTDTQNLVRTDEVYIPMVDGTNLELKSSWGAASIAVKPLLATTTISKIATVTVTLPTEYPEVWEQLLEGISATGITATVNIPAKQVIITSTEVNQIEAATGGATENALYSGILKLTKRAPPELPTTFTNIDVTTAYPRILSIVMTADAGTPTYRQTHSTITATVMNVTGPSDIHADLTDLTNNPPLYDEAPDYSAPDSISSASWGVSNSNTVRWTAITHPEYSTGMVTGITFWVYNSTLGQQYVTMAIFYRQSTNAWSE